jgi:predicted AAA+ superfamily ATPase
MNPFKYGGVVKGKYFYNRTKEIQQLKSDIKSGNNLILFAPRRFGKTSLISKANSTCSCTIW